MASARLALRKAVLSYSTVNASTSVVSSINTRALTYSTLSGSTINAATLFVNGSQITSGGSSQWSTIGSTITYAGNVGIGTSPQYKLDVAGSVNVTGGFYVNGTAFTGGGGGGIIVPNTTSLSSSSWTASSVNWTASASSNYTGYNAYKAFDNSLSSSWNTASPIYTTTGNSSGITTTIQGGIGSIQGDWLQLQSSTPLVISSYQLATGGGVAQFPNTFYIIGSNDGTTWYPIQKCIGVAQTNTAASTFITGTIIAATSGSQTFGNSSLTTTTYATTTNSYTYFRLLGTNTYGTNSYLEVGEWYATFTTPSSAGSQWTTTGSNISYSTGSVGIGTTAPQYAMDIVGGARMSQRVIQQYYGSTVFNCNSADGSGIVVYGGSGGSAWSTSGDVISSGVVGYVSYSYSGSYGNTVMTMTKGQYFPAFNGIYTISWTTRMAGGSEVIISKNRGNQNDYNNYGANPNYTPNTSLNGGGMLAHVAVNNNYNNACVSWTGYLSTSDYVCLGQYNGTGGGYSVSGNVVRSSATFTLIQSTA